MRYRANGRTGKSACFGETRKRRARQMLCYCDVAGVPSCLGSAMYVMPSETPSHVPGDSSPQADWL